MKVALKAIYAKLKMTEEAIKKIYCVQLTNTKRTLSVSLHPSSEDDMSKLVGDMDLYKVTEMDLETDQFKIKVQFAGKEQEVKVNQSDTLKIALEGIFKAMDLNKSDAESIDYMTLTNDKFVMSVALDWDGEQMNKLVEEFEMYHFCELALKCNGAMFKVNYDGKKHLIAVQQTDTMRVVFKTICARLELTQAQIENVDCLHLKNFNGSANMTLSPYESNDMKKLVQSLETYKFDEIILEMKRVELNVHFDDRAQKVMVEKTETIKNALLTIYKQIKMEQSSIPKINSLRLQNATKSLNVKLIMSDEDNMNKLLHQFDVFRITDLHLEIINIKKIDEKKVQ